MNQSYATCIPAAIFALAILPALADSPQLPTTAKHLTGKEIAALYDGLTVHWTNYTMGKPATGTDTYEFKTKTQSGSYQVGDTKGTFQGKLRVKGDLFCHQEEKGKEKCSSVYIDGNTIYETNSKGAVESMNVKQ